MPVEYFDPQTGNSYSFGPGQEPPYGWRELKPVSDPLAGFPPGSTVTWLPGRQPRLFVDPATGENRWIHSSVEKPRGWLPLRPLEAPPPPTFPRQPREVGQKYFDPATGESCLFQPGEEPPPRWKKLRPTPPQVPDLPAGSTVTWLPGREPVLYVDPDTGEQMWVGPPTKPPAAWIELRPRLGPLPDARATSADQGIREDFV
jgi:hypothetical protein